MKPSRKRRQPPERAAERPPVEPPRAGFLRLLYVDSNSLLAYRFLVIAMQSVTILVTWPLWQVREYPPLLPAFDLPQFNVGWLLIVSLVVMLAAPRTGLALHGVLLAWAMLQDQLRMQPEFISMWLLMLGTLAHPSAKLIARTHLITIWFFAAFHKLVCTRYYVHIVPPQMLWLTDDTESWRTIYDVLRGAIALFEMSLALLAIVPRTRKSCAWLALVFHLGVLQYLLFWAPTADDRFGGWNQAIWPWNVALAPAAFALLRPWQTSFYHEFVASRRWTRAVVLAMCIYPFGYYFGLVDAYPAHCLYSMNTPVAAVVRAGDNTVDQLVFIEALNVPFPPTVRLIKAYFSKTSKPGDILFLKDFRGWAKSRGSDDESYVKLTDDEHGERIAPLPRGRPAR